MEFTKVYIHSHGTYVQYTIYIHTYVHIYIYAYSDWCMECGGVDEWSSDTSQVDRPTNAQMICRLVKSTNYCDSNYCDLYPKIEVVRVPKTVYKTYVGAILSPKNSLTKAQYLHFGYLKMVDFFCFFSWSLGRRAASSEGESHLAVFFQEKSGDVVTLVSKLCHSWQTIDRASFIFTGVMDNGDGKIGTFVLRAITSQQFCGNFLVWLAQFWVVCHIQWPLLNSTCSSDLSHAAAGRVEAGSRNSLPDSFQRYLPLFWEG